MEHPGAFYHLKWLSLKYFPLVFRTGAGRTTLTVEIECFSEFAQRFELDLAIRRLESVEPLDFEVMIDNALEREGLVLCEGVRRFAVAREMLHRIRLVALRAVTLNDELLDPYHVDSSTPKPCPFEDEKVLVFTETLPVLEGQEPDKVEEDDLGDVLDDEASIVSLSRKIDLLLVGDDNSKSQPPQNKNTHWETSAIDRPAAWEMPEELDDQRDENELLWLVEQFPCLDSRSEQVRALLLARKEKSWKSWIEHGTEKERAIRRRLLVRALAHPSTHTTKSLSENLFGQGPFFAQSSLLVPSRRE